MPARTRPTPTARRACTALGHRRLRALLGLLAFAIAVLVGNVGLVARASAIASESAPIRALHVAEGRGAAQRKCTKARPQALAKRLHAGLATAALEDDDDDDDDGAPDTLLTAVEELGVPCAPAAVIDSAVLSAHEPPVLGVTEAPSSRPRAAYRARGPPIV